MTVESELKDLGNAFNDMQHVSKQWKNDLEAKNNGICAYVSALEKRVFDVEQIIGTKQFQDLIKTMQALQEFQRKYEFEVPTLIQQMAYMLGTLQRLERVNDNLHVYSTLKASQAMERIIQRLNQEQRQELMCELESIPIQYSYHPDYASFPKPQQPAYTPQATCARDIF
jgi:DNA repair ATPase RecN